MIVCCHCKEEKEDSTFTKNKTKRTGRNSVCKPCRVMYRVSYRRDNKAKLKLAGAKYYSNNKEYINKQNKAWRELNSEVNLENKRSWKRSNKGIVNACNARRRAMKLQATPKWADHEAIKSFYAFASFLTLATFDTGYHVDHVIPLQGKNVCGLHTEANLQVLRARDNISKSNKWAVI